MRRRNSSPLPNGAVWCMEAVCGCGMCVSPSALKAAAASARYLSGRRAIDTALGLFQSKQKQLLSLLSKSTVWAWRVRAHLRGVCQSALQGGVRWGRGGEAAVGREVRTPLQRQLAVGLLDLQAGGVPIHPEHRVVVVALAVGHGGRPPLVLPAAQPARPAAAATTAATRQLSRCCHTRLLSSTSVRSTAIVQIRGAAREPTETGRHVRSTHGIT